MEFSWTRIFRVFFSLIFIAGLVTGVYFFVTASQVKAHWANLVHNQHQYYAACQDLPFYPEVQNAISKHQDVIAKIQQAGAFNVTAHQINCPSSDGSYYFIKGDMEIDYHNRHQHSEIQKIIGDNFFGIPYRGYAK